MCFLKTTIRKLKKLFCYFCLSSGILFLTMANAYASATGLPWEGPLEKILDSLTGPVAKILGVLAIVIAGFGIAFGEAGSGMRRVFQVVLGLSIAFTASTLVVTLFGFSGGTVF
ncbi:MAG: TrbC/VirB2 family protein [Gammaproteobacteria bacterium]|jgi:type IV secretion system protein VirB2